MDLIKLSYKKSAILFTQLEMFWGKLLVGNIMAYEIHEKDVFEKLTILS